MEWSHKYGESFCSPAVGHCDDFFSHASQVSPGITYIKVSMIFSDCQYILPGVYQQPTSPVGDEASIPTSCGSQSCWNGCGVELGMCHRCALQDNRTTAATIGEPLFWDYHRRTEGQKSPMPEVPIFNGISRMNCVCFLNHLLFESRSYLFKHFLLDLRLSRLLNYLI